MAELPWIKPRSRILDQAGKSIIKKLESCDVTIIDYIIIPDNIDKIQELTNQHAKNNTDLLIFTGGTGLSPKDVTPEAILPLLDRDIE